MKKIFLLVSLIIFIVFSSLFSQYYKVEIIPPDKKIFLGDRVKFYIKISSNKEIKDIKLYDKNLKIKKKNKKEIILSFYKQFFKTGKITIPPVKLKVNGIEVFSDNLTIYVHSNLKKDSKFNDVKPPEKVKFYLTKKEKIILLILIILIILFFLLIIRLLKNRKKVVKKEEKFEFEYLLPYEEAKKNIEKCKEFLEKGRLDDFYAMLSYTLKRFIERKRKIKLVELTFEEIIDEYKDSLPHNIINLLEKWDTIRFSGNFPDFENLKQDLKNLMEVIENVENSRL